MTNESNPGSAEEDHQRNTGISDQIEDQVGHKKRVTKGALLSIFLVVFIDLLGFGIVLPLLPIYGKAFAGDYSEASRYLLLGLLMASFSAMQFFFAPIWGRLSDRVGRRPILLIGLAGSTLSYTLFGVAAVYQSLWALFLTRIGAGIAGATISTAQAYIADVTDESKRTKGMALIGAAFALGFTLGPAIGGVSLLFASGEEGSLAYSPYPGFLAGFFSGMALLFAYFKLPESWKPSESDLSKRPTRKQRVAAWHLVQKVAVVGILFGTIFISVFSFANFESTLSLEIEYLVQEDVETEGQDESKSAHWLAQSVKRWGFSQEQSRLLVIMAVFSYLGFILTLAQGFLVRRLSVRFSEKVLLVGGCLGTALGFGLLALLVGETSSNLVFGVERVLLFLLAIPIVVVSFAFVGPPAQSLLSKKSPQNLRGAVLGIGQSFSSLARIFGPVCGVSLMGLGAAYPYWVASGLLLVCMAVLLTWSQKLTSSES
ncbi:MAG: MFS transporter [Pirellulaceae bacterium]|nr:MFS transporter [Pirellulaceae bacterium]